MITNRGYRELMLKASKETNFQDPVESLRMKCLSRGASGILGLGSYRTRYCTPRRASARKQKPVKENGMSNTIKTPQTRKMPARQKIANSMKGKNEPPAKVSCNMVTKRCIIQVEPLVLNDVVITPLQTKRRASRSIPEESNVTPKRSKLNSPGNKELKVSVLSLRQSFHMCEVLEKVSESDTEEDSSDNQSLFIPSDTSGSSDDDDDDDDDDYSHNDSEKVSESDTGEDASDNQSLFTPSDTSGSFDDDDDDDDDNNDDHSHNDNENDESTNKPGRTLRSAKKKPMFTSIQETPRDMHEGLGKASESDTEENSSDNRSLFIPSDTSGSSDDDDDDDDDYSHNDSEKDESTNKPGRTLRSAGKKPMFTSVQDTPRGRCRVRRCPTLFGYLPKGSGDRGFTLQEERNRPSGNESRG
ncbi:bromodomain adjacent to zinc finger domain protein 2B-like isoform X16 [Acropora millepora]|uniref:bromodomain adjacent to zinc finger domain protein 2B-like isoform X16 n=1 Tax=Acropora millepora TaxID=45264 RepID=UPI001CF17FF9|nr:bromodomain adjacent to zinc finger domain protein 2B-like isoform X16 [Acropora millepora]